MLIFFLSIFSRILTKKLKLMSNLPMSASKGHQFIVQKETRSKLLTVDLSVMNHKQLIDAAAKVLGMAGITFGLAAHSSLGNLSGVEIEIADDNDLHELKQLAQNCLVKDLTVILKVVNVVVVNNVQRLEQGDDDVANNEQGAMTKEPAGDDAVTPEIAPPTPSPPSPPPRSPPPPSPSSPPPTPPPPATANISAAVATAAFAAPTLAPPAVAAAAVAAPAVAAITRCDALEKWFWENPLTSTAAANNLTIVSPAVAAPEAAAPAVAGLALHDDVANNEQGAIPNEPASDDAVAPAVAPATADTFAAVATAAIATTTLALPAAAATAIATTTIATTTLSDASPAIAAAIVAATTLSDASPSFALAVRVHLAAVATSTTPPADKQEAEMYPPDEHDTAPVTINGRKRRLTPGTETAPRTSPTPFYTKDNATYYTIDKDNIVHEKRASVPRKRPSDMVDSDGEAFRAAMTYGPKARMPHSELLPRVRMRLAGITHAHVGEASSSSQLRDMETDDLS